MRSLSFSFSSFLSFIFGKTTQITFFFFFQLQAKHDFLLAKPTVKTSELGSSDRFLILASDGLWNVLNDEKAVRAVERLLKEGNSPQQVCDKLTEEIAAFPHADNITVIILFFEWNHSKRKIIHDQDQKSKEIKIHWIWQGANE
jgi:serine/threonine protein phosphatase PrpC